MRKSLKMSDEFKKVLMMSGKIPIVKKALESIVEATFGVLKIEKKMLEEILSEEDFYEP